MNSSHKLIAYKMHFDRALILHHFFGITGEEGRMRRSTVGKRASLHMTDKSIMHALGLQCSCSMRCSDHWNIGCSKSDYPGDYINGRRFVEIP
jgi:hypothetical protein